MKIIVNTIAIICIIISCYYGYAEAIPVGTWSVIADGYQGSLVISSVDASGNLVSSTFFGTAITGFWSASQNKITFVRSAGTSPGWQTYVGYLYPSGSNYLLGGYFDFWGQGPYFVRTGWQAINAPATITVSPLVSSGAPPDTYSANSHGYTGTAVFNFPSNNLAGTFTGTWLGQTIQVGYYDPKANTVVFYIVDGTTPSQLQIYHGWITTYTRPLADDAAQYYFEIDGYFQAFSGTGATAEVPDYGWNALFTYETEGIQK